MKKIYQFILIFLISIISFIACNIPSFNKDKYNYEKYYGLVRFSEEHERLLIYIPNVGDVEIPEYDKIYGLNDNNEENTNSYQLKNGDFVIINFKYEKSLDDNSVKIYETYPARFDRKADYISVLKENISFGKNENGYELSFPLEKDLEIKVNDTLAFLEYKGENGRVKVTKIAEGIVLNINDNIITVSLNLLISEKNFFDRFKDVDIDLDSNY